MKSESLGYGPPPPEEDAMAAINALFPKKPERPPPRTLYDDLPDGISDPGVAPVLKVPEPTVLVKEREADELVPAFAKLRRVGFNDVMQHSWMIERLLARCPHLSPAQAQSQIRGYMYDQTAFLQMTDNAIAAAKFVRDSFLPPHVEVLFVLHRDIGPEGGNIRGSQGEKDAVQLLRAIRDWGKLSHAQEMTRITDVCDLSPGAVIKDLFSSERREDVWLDLR